MFVDRVQLTLIAGKGGNGIVAWRRERFIPKGGPYGGNGGKGGSVIFEADPGLYSLEVYRHKQKLKASSGVCGGVNLRQGRSGTDLILKVPYGTLIKDQATGQVLHDFTIGADRFTACVGGKGGRGNATFKTPTNRTPNICTPGRPGEEREIELELKLIADVGLVGMPNAGKSTLLSSITHAKVKIGDYPFTTLAPNLSYIECEDYTRILIADIPGIIKSAHENKGLGLSFLKHIERTSVLAFVLDILPEEEERNPYEDFCTLRNELGAYDPSLLDRPFLTVLNKMDKEGSEEALNTFKKQYTFPKETLLEISAKEGLGLPPLKGRLQTLVSSAQPLKEHSASH